MAYCGPRGIAWGEFLAWSKVSRDAAILWQLRENEKCTGCGTHPHDWDEQHGGHPRAYVAKLYTCKGCAAAESARDRLMKDAPPGSSVSLRRQVSGGAP